MRKRHTTITATTLLHPTLQVLPRLGQLVAQWSPLDAPALPAAEFASWRPLLESEAAQQGSVLGGAAAVADGSDPYMRLVAELVLPPLRKELTNSWDPRWEKALCRRTTAACSHNSCLSS